jgi:hypothetical protein
MRDPEFHHREHRGHRGRRERVSDPDPNPSFLPSVSVNSVLSVVKSEANLRETVVSTYDYRGWDMEGSPLLTYFFCFRRSASRIAMSRSRPESDGW